jgi:hypothetical protein
MNRDEKPFFVGYLAVPSRLKGFLIGVMALFVVLMGTMGLVVGVTQDDPGAGAFRFDYGAQTVTGIVQNTPYPTLYVTKGNDRIKAGHTMMLAGPAKNGAQGRTKKFDGQSAVVTGIVLERGSLDMLQVRNVKADENTPTQVPSEDLGTWKLSGEICDGKCLAGAMRPGRGLAHKACANLCLLGGVPPVFVTSQPVEGVEFLMIGNSDGGVLSPVMLDNVGAYISIEGQVIRRGDILLFLVDDTTIEVL